MRKIIIILLASILTLGNSFTFALTAPVENKSQWLAQIFIANQIKGIGLVDSYQEDRTNVSYVYDNSLAAIACIIMGNFGLAEEILDTLSKEVKHTIENVPVEYYYYSDINGNGFGRAYCGNSAWFLQALNIYQKARSSKRYYIMQKKLADFLLTLQDSIDGGLRGSTYDYWKSTEHNIIAYVALTNFSRLNRLYSYFYKAEKIKFFLKSPAIWDGVRFNRGPYDTTKVTDVQALGVLLLGNDYSTALTWAEDNFKLTKPFNTETATGFDFNGDLDTINTETVTGFDFNDDLDTIWLEGTLQMALAFYKANDARTGSSLKGEYYYNEASKTIQGDGSVVLATNRGTASEWWILEVWRAIAPTSWLIFYRLKFNPLIILY